MFVLSEDQNPAKPDGTFVVTDNLRAVVCTMQEYIYLHPLSSTFAKRTADNIASVYPIGTTLNPDEFYAVRHVLIGIGASMSGEDKGGGEEGTYIRHPKSNFSALVGCFTDVRRSVSEVRGEDVVSGNTEDWWPSEDYIELQSVVGKYDALDGYGY